MLLLSSTLQPPSDYFEGYCFAAADFISGNDGALKYEKETGKSLTAGNDGCYAIVRHTPDGLEVGTDGRGSMKLFLFQRNHTWAVSTSLTVLVDYLRSRGLAVTPKPEMIKALMLPGSFTQQLISSQTMYQDIRLVPSFEKLVINGSQIRTARAYEVAEEVPYEEALSQHVSTWRARLSTLMADPETVLTTDLSGGRDSRTCFAFAQASGLLETSTDRFRISSNMRWEADFKAATGIAHHYGHQLNTTVRSPERRGSAERALRRWHEQSMGVYLPVYLHSAAYDPRRLHLHGAGGGNFRKLYEATSLTAKLEPMKKHLPTADYGKLRDTAVADIETLKSKRPDVPELSLHYREFRNRFHFGFSPQCRTLLTPLNSILLDRVTDREGVDADGIYADIMDALVPGLKSLPYDDPGKEPRWPEPSPAAKSARDATIQLGSTYMGTPPEDAYKPGGRTFQLWLDETLSSLGELEPSSYITSTEIHSLKTFIDEARQLPRRPQANSPELKRLSYAAAVSFATK